jgi:hypothetical protein
MVRALALFAAILVAGCAGAFQKPSPEAGYGNPPRNYEATIRQHFENTLKDPESARYRFKAPPSRAYANEGLAYAKNSFGGYVGFKPYMVFFSGESIYRVHEGTSHVLMTRVD